MWLEGAWEGHPRDNRIIVRLGDEIPRKHIPWAVNRYIHLFDAWQKWKTFGLPYSGGWADQPAPLMDVLNRLEHAHAEWMTAKHKQAEQKAKSGQRHRTSRHRH